MGEGAEAMRRRSWEGRRRLTATSSFTKTPVTSPCPYCVMYCVALTDQVPVEEILESYLVV